jgi:lactam utilization protein B
MYHVNCKCGFHAADADKVRAEVIADTHEVRHSVRRAYRHDATVSFRLR